MQIKSLVLLGLSSTAFAANTKRDAPTLKTALTSINAAVAVYDKAIVALTDAAGVTAIQAGSDGIVKVVNEQASKVAASAPLKGVQDMFGIMQPQMAMMKGINETWQHMKSKKDIIQKIGAADKVAAGIADLKGAVKVLNKAMDPQFKELAASAAKQFGGAAGTKGAGGASGAAGAAPPMPAPGDQEKLMDDLFDQASNVIKGTQPEITVPAGLPTGMPAGMPAGMTGGFGGMAKGGVPKGKGSAAPPKASAPGA